LTLRPKCLLHLDMQHCALSIRRRLIRQNTPTPDGAVNNSPIFVATVAAADAYGEMSVVNKSP